MEREIDTQRDRFECSTRLVICSLCLLVAIITAGAIRLAIEFIETDVVRDFNSLLRPILIIVATIVFAVISSYAVWVYYMDQQELMVRTEIKEK